MGVVLLVNLLKYGVGTYPGWRVELALAQHWRDPMAQPLLTPPTDYLLSSPVSAVLAGLLHMTDPRRFFALSFVLACAAMVAAFAVLRVRRSPLLRLLVALLLVGSAVPATLLSWVGSYDPVSLGAATVAALAERPAVAFAAWLLFSFNNAPEAAIAVLVYILVLWLDGGRPALKRAAVCLSGVVVGYGAIRMVTAIWHGGESQFTMMKFYGFHQYVQGATNYWPLIIFSGLGAGWVFLLTPGVRLMAASKGFLVAALLVSILLPFIALDETRILAVTLWPGLLLVATLAATRLTAAQVLDALARLLPVAVVVVMVMAWTKQTVYAGPRDMYHFVQYLLGYQQRPPS